MMRIGLTQIRRAVLTCGDRVGAIAGRSTISTERTSGPSGGQSNTHSGAVKHFIDEFLPEDDVLSAARARGEEIGTVSVTPATGAALQWLAQTIEARTVAEVGTGAGVSGLWLLRGMSGDGVLTTVDDEAENTNTAKQTFADAGIPTQRTRLITGRPNEVLSRLADGAYDLVFLDGEPQETGRQIGEAVRLLREGGVVVVDHVLAEGRVPDPAQRDADTIAMRTLLADARADERLRPLLLPVGDGLLVAQKLAAEITTTDESESAEH